MSFSFWALNLKGILGLLSGLSRCLLDISDAAMLPSTRALTYHIESVASRSGRDGERTILLPRGGAVYSRGASECCWDELGSHDLVVLSEAASWRFNVQVQLS